MTLSIKHFGHLPGQVPAALLFDLDGTLVDSVPDIGDAVDAALNDLGMPAAGEERARQWVGNGSLVLMRRALAHAIGVADTSLDEDRVQQAYGFFLTHYQRSNGVKSCLYRGVEQALAGWQQQGIPMAVVTNKPVQFVPALLSRLGIADYFSSIVGGDCAAEKKPSPQPLFLACKQLGVSPQTCLMVGDSRHDIQAARAASVPVLAVTYGYNHGDPISLSEPDWVVDDLSLVMLEAD